ncbi:unnamed protein product [Clonostachys solani]|uniref:EthD domain-containing protein n=1 Tax=Clonostachys solani TaxID=160281 RepID=A0A9N9ZMD0_9HYPO|nr:unnamed protein product [Clonostachys solani]
MSSKLVRITILVRKRDDLSYEEFHKYWSEKHPDIWLSVPIVQEKIVKYSQFHANEAVRSAYGSAMPLASYDGAAEMWAASMEDLLAVFTNEEYQRIVVPDEQKFLKREEAQMIVGWEEPKWVDGNRV